MGIEYVNTDIVYIILRMMELEDGIKNMSNQINTLSESLSSKGDIDFNSKPYKSISKKISSIEEYLARYKIALMGRKKEFNALIETLSDSQLKAACQDLSQYKANIQEDIQYYEKKKAKATAARTEAVNQHNTLEEVQCNEELDYYTKRIAALTLVPAHYDIYIKLLQDHISEIDR